MPLDTRQLYIIQVIAVMQNDPHNLQVPNADLLPPVCLLSASLFILAAVMIVSKHAFESCSESRSVPFAGNSLTAPFVESFDKLSGNSQQALQQLVSHSSKLIPEGSSVRDSFDRLSGNTQRALYHLAQSGLSLPSFLPHKNSHEADSAALTGTDGLEVAKATVARLQAELSKAEKENALVTDLLQHSQHELSLSQARTHDLLASIAKVEDERSWLANQNARLRATLENNPEAKECVQQHSVVPGQEQTQQCPPCTASDDAKELYGTLGSQVSPCFTPCCSVDTVQLLAW